MPLRPRRICYVTGTRADFGLMANTLRAIRSHPHLRLQLVVTGMHLDPAHGRTINQLRRDGWPIDATIPWQPAGHDLTKLAEQTSLAAAKLATAFAKLDPDVVLVTGDRVEAFAAASAAHLSGRVLAHVHGGDRALGQVDDALRHAITKLAHVHFPATKQSADRIAKLGEEKWRIHRVGSPGLDGIRDDAWSLTRALSSLPLPVLRERAGVRAPAFFNQTILPRRYALLLLHPTDAHDESEYDRATLLLRLTRAAGPAHTVVVYPNNDPGSAGILRAWDEAQLAIGNSQRGITFARNLPRPAFLALLRDAAVLVGNSSAGIIEAASFGTPVLDIGPRQQGRERGPNVTTVPFTPTAIRRALKSIWNNGHPKRHPQRNPYGAGDTAHKITHLLATLPLDARLRRKLIAY